MASFSVTTGIVFLVSFLAMAASGGSTAGLLGFTGAVILASAWLSTIFYHFR